VNFRFIWMFLIGLAVAIGFLGLTQFVDFRPAQPGADPDLGSAPLQADAQDLSVASDLNSSIMPANFRTVVETGNSLGLNGTGEVGAIVSILNNNERLRQVRVNDNGIWSTSIDIVPDQIMEISLILFLETGGKIGSDETVFRVPLPLTGINIDAPRAGSGAGEIPNISPPPALILVTAPGGPSRIVQSPFGSMPTDGPLSVGPIDYDDLGGVIFSGLSQRPGRVRIYANNSVIGDTGVGPTGRWFYIAGDTVSVGAYDISAELMTNDAVEARIVIPFERLSPALAQSDDDTFVKFEPMRWQLRRRLSGGGAQYTAIFAPSAAEALPVPRNTAATNGAAEN